MYKVPKPGMAWCGSRASQYGFLLFFSLELQVGSFNDSLEIRSPPGLGRVVASTAPSTETVRCEQRVTRLLPWADLEPGIRFVDQKHPMWGLGSVDLPELWLCSRTHRL